LGLGLDRPGKTRVGGAHFQLERSPLHGKPIFQKLQLRLLIGIER
jgi:hypothetical protein